MLTSTRVDRMASEPIRTLVVEDEPSARHLIQEILQARGHDVEACADADLPVRFALAERKIYFLQDRKRTEEGLTRDALRDSVTDLVNRTLFTERLHRTARRAQRKNQMPGQGFLFGRPRPADELTKFFHGREARA